MKLHKRFHHVLSTSIKAFEKKKFIFDFLTGCYIFGKVSQYCFFGDISSRNKMCQHSCQSLVDYLQKC